MRVKDLASKWGIRSKANKTEKLYEIHLKDVDAAKVAAIASLFDVHSEEEIISASAVPSSRMGMIRSTNSQESSDSSEAGEDKFSDAERRLREELAAFKIK